MRQCTDKRVGFHLTSKAVSQTEGDDILKEKVMIYSYVDELSVMLLKGCRQVAA